MADKKPDKGFFPDRLNKMVEPITVRVEKIVGGVGSTVELPAVSGGTNDGNGWMQKDVYGLEPWIDAHHGPGVYEAKIADANGTTMQWVFGKRPQLSFGQQQPQQTQLGGVAAPTQIPYTGAQQGSVIFAPPAVVSGQNGWTQSMPQVQQQGMVWNGMQWVQSPPAAWNGGYNNGQFPFASPPDDKVARLQAELEEQKRLRIESEAKAERERAEARHTQELAAQRDELAKLREMIAAQAAQKAQPTEDPRARALEEQNRELRARADRQESESRFQQQLAAMQQQTAQLITSMQAQMQQQNAQMQAQLAATQNNQSAMLPVISLMQTAMASSADAAKESARAVATSQDKTIAFLQQNQSQGDQVLKQVNGAFDTYSTVMKGAFDMMMQSQGGSPSIGDKVLEAATALGMQGKTLVEKYLNNKREKQQLDLKKSEIDANVEIAKEQIHVQAEAIKAGVMPMAQPQVVQAVQDPQAPQPQVVQDPQTAFGGAPGQPVAPPAFNGQPTATTENPTSADAPKPPVLKMVSVTTAQRDQEIFGHPRLIEEVGRLRLGVRTKKLTIEQVAVSTLQAVTTIKQAGLDVPALHMFDNGQFDELFEALLPAQASSYREECAMTLIGILNKMAQQAQAPPSHEEDDDGGEEDEGDEQEDSAS